MATQSNSKRGGVENRPRRYSNTVLLSTHSTAEDGTEDLIISATLKRFGTVNVNGDVYTPDCYDRFLNAYYNDRGYNIPLTVMHGHGLADIIGRVEEVEKSEDEKTLSVTCRVFSTLPDFGRIKELINRGVLQGLSDDGYAIDYDYEETPDGDVICVCKDCVMLNVSLVSTPAEPAAGVSVANTLFKGFNPRPSKLPFLKQSK